MSTITISGHSDDLIEIGGAISEEFTLRNDDDGDLIALSNGAVFRVTYTADGIWRVTPVVVPDGVAWSKTEAVSSDAPDYSDEVTVAGVEWVVHVNQLAR